MSLSTAAVYDASIDAWQEYADHKGVDLIELFSTDGFMEAVAWYVEEHMEYQADAVFQNEHSAFHTLVKSHMGDCGKDYCGDCEDFAILRTALLRRLGVSWECVYNVDHYEDFGGHTFNHVLYKNKWRIMDYNELPYYFTYRWDQHDPPDNVWNDHVGEFWCHWSNFECTVGHDPRDYTRNYVGGIECPSGGGYWYDTYYTDRCP
jgi:hypothetical protein